MGTTAVEPVAAPAGAPAPAPAAPVTPEPKAPETAAKPNEALDRRGARQQMLERARTKVPEAKPAATPTPVAATPVADPAKSAEAAAPVAPAVIPEPQKFEVVIPADHPAARGKLGGLKYTFDNQEQADAMKAMLNATYVRPKELEAAQAKADAYELSQLREETKRTTLARYRETPAFKEAEERNRQIQQAEIDGAVPKGSAQRDWQVTLGEFEKVLDVAVQEVVAKREEGKTDAAAEAWIDEAYRKADGRIPDLVRALPGYRGWFEQAIKSFNSELGLGHIQIPDASDGHEEFRQFLAGVLARQGDVQKALQLIEMRKTEGVAAQKAATEARERELKAAVTAGVEEFKKSTAAQRTQAPPHPLGNLNAPRTAPPTGDPVPPAGRQPPAEGEQNLRREGRNAAMQRARERLFPT